MGERGGGWGGGGSRKLQTKIRETQYLAHPLRIQCSYVSLDMN